MASGEKTKALHEKHQRILADMLRKEENRFCADCGSRGELICFGSNIQIVYLKRIVFSVKRVDAFLSRVEHPTTMLKGWYEFTKSIAQILGMLFLCMTGVSILRLTLLILRIRTCTYVDVPYMYSCMRSKNFVKAFILDDKLICFLNLNCLLKDPAGPPGTWECSCAFGVQGFIATLAYTSPE